MHSKHIFIFLLLFISYQLFSQNDESALTGINSAQDTTKVEKLYEVSKLTGGLIDGKIDPNEYIVGPGDEFRINIDLAKSKSFKTNVSPDGRLLIEGAGAIEVDGLNLKSVYKKIEEKLKSRYNSDDISIVLSDIRKFKVVVSGDTYTQVTVPASSTERVNEVINKAGGLEETSSLRNIKLVRDGSVIDVDLLMFFNVGDKESNPYVVGGDQIIVPPFNKQSTLGINGEVPKPIETEYKDGDKLSDLIKLSHGILNSADLSSVEITRLANDGKSIEKIYADISDWKGDLYSSELLKGDIDLQPGDRVYIKKKKNWKIPSYVKITGEVNYPGKYTIELGKTRISDIIDRAGGFNENAYISASTLIRQKEKEREDLQLTRLENMDRSEMTVSELKYYQAKVNERRGLMAVNFNNAIDDPSSVDNILLQDRDSIIVPEKIDFINVQGRVNNPGNVQYNEKFNYLDYIALAGGFGYRADLDETFITKSKGEQFLAEDFNYKLEPGDTILVPPEEDVTFFEVFSTALTIATQLVTVVGVVITIVRLQ
jgi:protein involved in polysaccharide export with SLBB domain